MRETHRAFASSRTLRPATRALGWLGGVCALIATGTCQAQEIYGLVGKQHTPDLDEDSYAFSLMYAHNLTDYAYATFSVLNEGHVTDHHRDGDSPQLWLRKLSRSRQFDLSAGIGPYRYFDTTGSATAGGHVNDHGFGVMYSVAAHWYAGTRWVVQLRYNHVEAHSSIDTDTLLLGIGYQLDAATRPGPIVPPASYGFATDDRNELALLVGKTIVNNFESPNGPAWALQYRRQLTPYIDASVTALDEGEAGDVKRRGLAPQIWLERRFSHNLATVGCGVGPYFARDSGDPDTQTRVLGLFSIDATYQFAPAWVVQAFWYRTLTTNSRDTDVIVAGIARQF